MRFRLIDHVLEQSDDRLLAVKALTSAEEYLDDHFPNFPVMPGVLMLETLAQAARLLMRRVDGPTPRPLVMREVRNVRYAAMVRPGQSLTVEVTLRKREDEGLEFQGIGWVEGNVALQGRFRMTPICWGADARA